MLGQVSEGRLLEGHWGIPQQVQLRPDPVRTLTCIFSIMHCLPMLGVTILAAVYVVTSHCCGCMLCNP
jgi:hypothetical protein